MPSNFPAGFDSIAADKSNSTVALNDHSSHHNDLADAVNAIQTSLGVNLANVIGLPQQGQSANYTLTLADAGRSVVHPITDNNARTFTIPPNFSVAYPVGTQITFVNMANTLTVELANDLMYLAGFSTYPPASVRLDAYGVATALKVTNTSWIISGQNLTADASLSYNFLAASSLPSSITFTRASTATFFNSAGVLTSADINTPRLDYNPSTLAARGLLIEEQRTNSIRNNTMQGAVAGTPGTLPTNWTAVGTGLAFNVVGLGTEAGLPYIDIQVVGTTGGTSAGIRFDTNTGIAAVAGQTWTSSAYARMVAGSTTNISAVSINCSFLDAVAGIINSTSVSFASTISQPSLPLARRTVENVVAGVGTLYARSQIIIGYASGVAIDFTLRIGLPQLEQGAFATSVIPTTTTALTRSADVASVNTLSPWFNATEGTLFAEWTAQAFTHRPATFNDGTQNNAIALVALATSIGSNVYVSNVFQGTAGVSGTFTTGTTYKQATAYKLNDTQDFANGVAATTDTTISIPTVTQLLLGAGRGGMASSPANGWLRRFTYYPRRLSQAEGIAITA